MSKKQVYSPAMAEHLHYVQSQKHTRGDLQRALKQFNGHGKKQLKGDVHVSTQVKQQNSFERGTVGSRKYETIGGKLYSLNDRTCRVCVNR